MKKKKLKQVSVSGNNFFKCCCIVRILILACSCIISIVDKMYHIINWPDLYENVLGVSSQVITALVSLVVSIIGIAISLQNEEFFGVKITKLYALRINKHYSILEIIIISIFLCTLNLAFFMLGLTSATIGTLIAAFIFLLQVVYAEVPIMGKEEEAILKILKDNLVYCYLNNVEASKDLKDAIKYLLYSKNLKEVYEVFKDKDDQKYNRHMFLKLLEYQHDLAFEFNDKYDENTQKIIGSSLIENVFDVVLRHIEITNETYSEIVKNRHLLTHILFRIHGMTSTRELFLKKISGLYQYSLFMPINREQECDLISDIIIILVAGTVKTGDFSIVKVIRRQLSIWAYCLSEESYALDTFAVISMYLYYLNSSERDVPTEIRSSIQAFINENNLIEEQTKITSWKRLFTEAAKNFKVDYNRFVLLAMRNSDVLEYYLFGRGTKVAILNSNYLSRWFLTNLLNTEWAYSVNYSLLVDKYQNIRPYLISFGNSCIDENMNFIPTTDMEQIVEFYSTKGKYFVPFRIEEERNHRFFEFVNSLKFEELKKVSEQAGKVNNVEFASKICDDIEIAIKNEWGFDPNLSIEDAERSFSMFLEKSPEAINFEESIIEFCISSILLDIKEASKKTVLYDDDSFENGIRRILSKKPAYITRDVKYTIPHFYIKDQQLKEAFQKACEDCKEFESKLLGIMSLAVEDGFRFNCRVQKVELRHLSENELAEKIGEYQRADGQFVFDGVFLPREEIKKIVENKFAILSVAIQYHVQSSEDTVFELKPYSKCPQN